MATTRFGPFPVSKGDVLTGVNVQGEDQLQTIATGWVSFARVIGRTFDADGDDWSTPPDFPAPLLKKHSLIVKFGGGPWYQGGKDKAITVPAGESGEVILRTNDHDDWLWDNDNYWEVSLVLTRLDPPPPPSGPPEPVLRIAAIEVVQAIQRAGNSVRLVQGKRTVVRVFVDSGLRNGQDVGAGANLWPGVTGSLTVFDAKRGGPITLVNFPLNPGMTARPASSIDREQWDHSLNFELPATTLVRDPLDPPWVKSTTALEIRAIVKSTRPVPGHGGSASGSVTVSFHERFTQPLLPILVELTYPTVANPRPTMAQFDAAVRFAVARYPVAENGFAVNPPFYWTTSIDTSAELQLAGLLSQLGTVALLSSTPVNGIRCALLPDGPGRTGMGGAFIWGSRLPVFIAMASQVESFAHEMGHAFGVHHSQCSGDEGWYDGRIPGRIDDVGLDVQGQPPRVIPKLTPDVMSYCTGVWCSVQFFQLIFKEDVI